MKVDEARKRFAPRPKGSTPPSAEPDPAAAAPAPAPGGAGDAFGLWREGGPMFSRDLVEQITRDGLTASGIPSSIAKIVASRPIDPGTTEIRRREGEVPAAERIRGTRIDTVIVDDLTLPEDLDGTTPEVLDSVADEVRDLERHVVDRLREFADPTFRRTKGGPDLGTLARRATSIAARIRLATPDTADFLSLRTNSKRVAALLHDADSCRSRRDVQERLSRVANRIEFVRDDLRTLRDKPPADPPAPLPVPFTIPPEFVTRLRRIREGLDGIRLAARGGKTIRDDEIAPWGREVADVARLVTKLIPPGASAAGDHLRTQVGDACDAVKAALDEAPSDSRRGGYVGLVSHKIEAMIAAATEIRTAARSESGRRGP